MTDAGSGSPGTATQGVTVAAVNDAPTVANVDGNAFTWTEGDAATHIDVGNDGTVVDPDSADFNGGSFTVGYQGGQQAEDRIVIDTSGTVSLSAGQTAGQHGVRGRQCDRHDPGRRDRRCERGADDHLHLGECHAGRGADTAARDPVQQRRRRQPDRRQPGRSG